MNFFGLDIRRRQQDTRLDFVKNFNIKTVVEIGANIGVFTQKINTLVPQAKIYTFEPVRETYNILIDQKISNTINHNFGLGDQNMTTTINVPSRLSGSSMFRATEALKYSAPNTNFSKTTPEEIILKKLDDLSLPIEDDLMINIDVEGYEYKVILDGKNTISRAKVILMETALMPMYEGQKTFTEIYDLLRDLGFEYKGCLHSTKKYRGLPVYEDALFIKK